MATSLLIGSATCHDGEGASGVAGGWLTAHRDFRRLAGAAFTRWVSSMSGRPADEQPKPFWAIRHSLVASAAMVQSRRWKPDCGRMTENSASTRLPEGEALFTFRAAERVDAIVERVATDAEVPEAGPVSQAEQSSAAV